MKQILRVINKFREYENEITANAISTLLILIEQGGVVSQKELGDRLGIPQSTVSRTVAHLGEGSFKKEGLGLVTTREDPKDRRFKIVVFTPKGKNLASEVEAIVKGL